MKHDYDIRAFFKRFPVAGLLICSVTQIPFVLKNLKPQAPGNLYCPVMAMVVYDQYFIDHAPGDIAIGFFKGLLRIIGGHYYDYLISF
jgi:hypothetical protein